MSVEHEFLRSQIRAPRQRRFAYLGPEATFTEAALRSLAEAVEAERVPFQTVAAPFAAVRDGSMEAAMATLENSVEGPAPATLAELVVGDHGDAVTRFVLLRRPGPPPRIRADRTSILAMADRDQPGWRAAAFQSRESIRDRAVADSAATTSSSIAKAMYWTAQSRTRSKASSGTARRFVFSGAIRAHPARMRRYGPNDGRGSLRIPHRANRRAAVDARHAALHHGATSRERAT
jgi:hypothetical protein